MYRLPLLIAWMLACVQLSPGQRPVAKVVSPHGENLKMDCALCHSTDGWQIPAQHWQEKRGNTKIFNHDNTEFPLTGTHLSVDCRNCHENLIFEQAPTDCIGCHQDVHQTTVGNDCARCHTTAFWLVDKIPELHEEVGFPLTGVHEMLFCVDCHQSETNLRFERMGNDCITCHRADYEQTTSPDHQSLNFSFNCLECHTTDEGWEGGNGGFPDHDAIYFPIYSGTHEGTWTECQDCHTTPGDFTQFACTNCHVQTETDDNHQGISGYVYSDNACYACHPTGTALDNFDHSLTNFPLTGAHIGLDCEQCHSQGYAGTSSYCFDCHQQDYQASVNPQHASLNFPQDCASCHTTDPGWTPATFDIHDDYYVLQGAHAQIATECTACHTNGNYSNTPNTCVGCHQSDYNSANNPNHSSEGYPTACDECHSEDAWQPASFDHDGDFFPIYSGKHKNKWDVCAECHLSAPDDFSTFSCIECHEHDDPVELADKHSGVSGYVYESTACYSCHPTGN